MIGGVEVVLVSACLAVEDEAIAQQSVDGGR
jgi:hypothetical protein